jgi:mRNA-degrading endonuclease RelE of RelBE toxin-antitoxin system
MAISLYKIFILFEDKLEEYENVKNNIKFWEKWTKDLKKELNNQYKIIFDRLESIKELRGQKEKLNKTIEIKINNIEKTNKMKKTDKIKINLFSDRVNDDIRIIFSIFNNTNTIVVWGIDHHEKAYGKIIKHAESFIKNHQKSILELLGIKTIYR